ncbi:hypothetical protein ACN26Y_28835 [Micromonospora sp. WMMD558]|uniref:hypothetical protein n=1 Tax=Micromonospora sp. WMMD558 TaxID=3403462 RepID=UPI003BF4E5D9
MTFFQETRWRQSETMSAKQVAYNTLTLARKLPADVAEEHPADPPIGGLPCRSRHRIPDQTRALAG